MGVHHMEILLKCRFWLCGSGTGRERPQFHKVLVKGPFFFLIYLSLFFSPRTKKNYINFRFTEKSQEQYKKCYILLPKLKCNNCLYFLLFLRSCFLVIFIYDMTSEHFGSQLATLCPSTSKFFSAYFLRIGIFSHIFQNQEILNIDWYCYPI